ncbi:MAG: hypothetical protein WCH99_14510 [Verrucomicrobiota bacterium]
MYNATTHYQTSFRVNDADGDGMRRVKADVYGWVAKKESDRLVRKDKAAFFFRCNWTNLYETHSTLCTDSHLSQAGDAWAMRYTEIDKECGRKRFWHSDIGLKKEGATVIVSVRVSFAWNAEDLSHDHEAPNPSVPVVVRYILQDNHVFSGRPEFRLLERPIPFNEPGVGKALCKFIQSPERRYPLVVFNGDSADQVREAKKLARELTGKCMVAIIASNIDLADEIKMFLPADYRIPYGQFRVFFPFSGRRNSPVRHRWYDIHSAEYAEQRQGIVNGLLRNHSLLEAGAVETVDEIRRLVAREELMKLKVETPDQQKQLNEFLEEHARVAAERDQFKREAEAYAADIDRLEDEVRGLDWRCKDYQGRLDAVGDGAGVDVSKLLPVLPTNLAQVAEAAGKFFPRLVITEAALEAARDYNECKSISEAWEMLGHLNEAMYRTKFEEGSKEIEKTFQDRTGYEVAMKEGPNTKNDKKLMDLRKLIHGGKEYDISPHLKHGNKEPKLVRIYFAFDEDGKKIVVGHIGRHIPNATTKTM